MKITEADIEQARKGAQVSLGIPDLDRLSNLDWTCIYYRFIYLLVHRFNLADCAELGVYAGRCTVHMAAANPAGKVYAVDPRPHELFEGTTCSYPNIQLIRKSSTEPEALELVPNETLALCFIDSIHDPDYALLEVKMWTPKMREGGVFLFDDLAYTPGMARVIPEIPFKRKGRLDDLHYTGFGYAIKE